MQNYAAMRREGKSIPEIADAYNLSYCHAYYLVRILAKEQGVSYESLLDQPHSTHIMMGSGKAVKPVERVNFSDFEKDFREGISAFDKTLFQMDKVLAKWETEEPMNLEEEK